MLVDLPAKFDKYRLSKGVYITGFHLELKYDPDTLASGIRFVSNSHDPIVNNSERYIQAYGVCDNYIQVLAHIPELESSAEMFMLSLSPVRRSTQPAIFGWRWHKWGEYIGTQNPQCEYIADEPHIELVYCYHVYRVTKQ